MHYLPTLSQWWRGGKKMFPICPPCGEGCNRLHFVILVLAKPREGGFFLNFCKKKFQIPLGNHVPFKRTIIFSNCYWIVFGYISQLSNKTASSFLTAPDNLEYSPALSQNDDIRSFFPDNKANTKKTHVHFGVWFAISSQLLLRLLPNPEIGGGFLTFPPFTTLDSQHLKT